MTSSQLFAQLVAPGGQAYTLFSQTGRGGADFDQTLLDSEAPFTLDERAAPWLGSLRPLTNLDALAGQSTAGQWKLRLQDLRPDDGLTGQLLGWTLLIRIHEPRTFAAWAATLPPDSPHGPLDDADGDGLANLFACALAGEAPRWSRDEDRLALRYTRWTKTGGYQLFPQTSANLRDWTTPAGPRFEITIQERRPDGTEQVKVTTRPDSGTAFLRLKAVAE